MSQLSLPKTAGWGGKRKGAGRKPLKNQSPGQKKQNHVARPSMRPSQPVHVTLRLVKGLGRLRTKTGFRVFHKAVVKAQRKGLRLIHYSIQSNHLHLIVEADGNLNLSRALQSLAISFAKQLNKVKNRVGRVFSDRYHMQVLRTSTQVKNAIKYVLLNAAKHKNIPAFLDPFSSGPVFDQWSLFDLKTSLNHRQHFEDKLLISYIEDLVRLPRSWLLRVGWSR